MAIEVEAEVEVEGVQYYAIGVETSFLKNRLVIKWLNVPIRNKPKIAGGKISWVMFKGDSHSTIREKGKLTRGTTHKSKGEVPVVSPIDSKPLKEIKQMLELEKNSSKSTSVDDTTHSFTPTSNVRNGFRRKKGDSPFTYNLNLKVKKEKKQSNCTNPDPWARIVGSRNTAAIYMNGVATTALFDTGAEIQLVSKQFCEDNEWEIQPIENLTECSTVNGEIFGYEGFVEVNVQIPGRDFLKIICFWLLLKSAIRRRYQLYLGLTSLKVCLNIYMELTKMNLTL